MVSGDDEIDEERILLIGSACERADVLALFEFVVSQSGCCKS